MVMDNTIGKILRTYRRKKKTESVLIASIEIVGLIVVSRLIIFGLVSRIPSLVVLLKL